MQEEGRRIKFACQLLQSSQPIGGPWCELAAALKKMERCGFTPIMADGRYAGNIAVCLREGLLVSRSGRLPGTMQEDDFVHVCGFDAGSWQISYRSQRQDVEPSSDTPLYWTALIDLPEKLGWQDRPKASLHGHAFVTEEAAAFFKLPVSMESTEFGTPADCHALSELLTQYPYPQDKVYIRKGHGFFILGESIQETVSLALQLFKQRSN